MKKHIFITALLGLLCSCGASGDKHNHEEEDSHSSVQVTATQGNIELYAECEHLEEGEEGHLEAWFTDLDSFKAAEVESPVLLYKTHHFFLWDRHAVDTDAFRERDEMGTGVQPHFESGSL